MKRIYLTCHKIPKEHVKYGVIEILNNTMYISFSDDLNYLKYKKLHKVDITITNSAWDVPFGPNFETLLAHPNIIQFTQKTHPEYFL